MEISFIIWHLELCGSCCMVFCSLKIVIAHWQKCRFHWSVR